MPDFLWLFGLSSTISLSELSWVLVAQLCLTLCEPTNCSPPGSSVYVILQQEYWSRLSFPSLEDLPNLGIEPRSPALQADSLPTELQASPRVCSNSCPLTRWCHPTILFSVTLFSSCLQCFPASGSFPVSQLFASSGQSIAASASARVLPMNIHGWFPLGID